MSCDSRGARNAIKGRCSVPAGATSQCATSRPRLKIRPPRLVFQRKNRLQEHEGLTKVSQRPGCLQALSRHPVVHRFRLRAAGCLAPPGLARARSRLKSKSICVREQTEQTVLNKLGGLARWWEGSRKNNPVKVFSSLRLPSPSSSLAKDKKQ